MRRKFFPELLENKCI